MKSNDERVLELMEKIKEREEVLLKRTKFSPLTNCILELDGIKKNIQVLTLEELKYLTCKLTVLSKTYQELFNEDLVIGNFKATEWLEDLNSKINQLTVREKKEELNSMKKRLDSLLSKDKKIELELDKFEDFFNN